MMFPQGLFLWTPVTKKTPFVRTTGVAIDSCQACGPESQGTEHSYPLLLPPRAIKAEM